jgi:hypothetical protein
MDCADACADCDGKSDCADARDGESGDASGENCDGADAEPLRLNDDGADASDSPCARDDASRGVCRDVRPNNA